MALRVVFFGTPEFAATVLDALLASPHDIAAAVASPDRPSGRGRKVRPGAVSALARERGIELLQPPTLREPGVLDGLRAVAADVFAVASYGRIFSREALAIPRLCALNAHASVLPALRGAAPVERAILGGLTRTGVSIQRMVREVDAGDVYTVSTIDVGARETAASLRGRLAALAAGLLPEVLSSLESGEACAVPQDESAVTYAPPLEAGERAVRWAEDAVMTDRRVRAFAPRPGAFALLPEGIGRKGLRRLKLIKVVETEPTEPTEPERAPAGRTPLPGQVIAASERDGLVVACGRGALSLVTVQPEGKRPMEARAFLRGHRVRAGMRLLDGLG